MRKVKNQNKATKTFTKDLDFGFSLKKKMSGTLENRSSLRKLEFPNCTIEALKRLHATCVSVSHKLPVLDNKMVTNPAAFLVLAPKETELVLDIIDEFVFFTKLRFPHTLNKQVPWPEIT